MADTILAPLMDELILCLCDALAANPNPVAECCLRVGPVIHDVDAETSIDKVCCPGLGFARLDTVFPSSDWPSPDNRSDKCLSLSRAVEITIGTVRCIPGMGTPAGPGCDDWEATAIQDFHDIDALFSAVCCFSNGAVFKSMRGRRYTIQGSQVLSQGGCVERTLTLLVEIGRCC